MPKRQKSVRKLREPPMVSICTPTFNRRPFIPGLIRMVEGQLYDKRKIEWVVVDDGTDPVEDLIQGLPYAKYVRLTERTPLGEKRNILNRTATGDIIVNMDDDDYYPPSRVKHAVEMLLSHPSALCAGCSESYLYSPIKKEMFQVGPYHSKHAEPASFAFRKKLITMTEFETNAWAGEGKHFLKNYSVPFVQLEPKKTMLTISHRHDVKDKTSPAPGTKVSKSDRILTDFVKEDQTRVFIDEGLDHLLEGYPEGGIDYKADMVADYERLDKENAGERLAREDKLKEDKRKEPTNVVITLDSGKSHKLTNGEVEALLQRQSLVISELRQEIASLKEQLKEEEEHENDRPAIELEIEDE